MKQTARRTLLFAIIIGFAGALWGCNDTLPRIDETDRQDDGNWEWSADDNTFVTHDDIPRDEMTTIGDNSDEESSDDEENSNNQNPSGFVAHEWGTFTSVVNADGEYMPGLHHQGVALPPFVHDMKFSGPGLSPEYNPDPKGPDLPQPATQKLETPVIYFYTDEPRDVNVQVDFPRGYITRWYPDAIEQWPTMPECDWFETHCTDEQRAPHGWNRLADGRMTWDVSITHEDKSSEMVEVPPEDIWAPSRRVPDAAFVQHGQETDRFIFYRGIGRASLPFKITARESETGPEFTFKNQSDQRIPDVYLLHITEDRGRIVQIGGVGPGDAKIHDPAPKELGTKKFVAKAKRIVKGGLEETGLTEAESEAMVETWAHSYFRATGYRVLYVLPRAWTDRLLPIDIEPTPDKLVRTLVGRVEVITPGVAQKTLQELKTEWNQNPRVRLEDIYRGGRFEEPHFRQACRIATSDEFKSWCDTQLKHLSAEVISEDGFSGY